MNRDIPDYTQPQSRFIKWLYSFDDMQTPQQRKIVLIKFICGSILGTILIMLGVFG